jgi:hypothetical protein
MTQLTLLAKAHNAGQLKQVESLLKKSFVDLALELKIVGVGVNSWVQVTLSGEDEAIATSYISKEVSFCPVSLENVARFATLKGYIAKINQYEVQVDVGVFQPEAVYANIPLNHLQASLADGRKLALKKITELFGFCEDLPVNVKIVTVNRMESRLEAELATEQLERFMAWQESLLDRLIVLGSPFHDVKKMLRRTGLNRDVISIESLGIFEHALTCKLGTDAAGLISLVGRNLRNTMFAVFNPRKIRGFFGNKVE